MAHRSPPATCAFFLNLPYLHLGATRCDGWR
nr:MAG TPA: hypothetical protein [Bacteriophage sp.]